MRLWRARTNFRSSTLDHPRLAQRLVGADHLLQPLFAGAVAGVGVRVQPAHQLGVAGADLRPLDAGLEVELGQRAALDLAELGAFRLGGRRAWAAAAEQVER